MEIGKVFNFKHRIDIGSLVYNAVLLDGDVVHVFWDQTTYNKSDWVDFTRDEADKFLIDGDWILTE